MKEFFVGLLVLLMLLLFSIIGVLLLPFIIVLGFVLKCLISLALLVFAVWLVGWVTLWGIDYLKSKEKFEKSRSKREEAIENIGYPLLY